MHGGLCHFQSLQYYSQQVSTVVALNFKKYHYFVHITFISNTKGGFQFRAQWAWLLQSVLVRRFRCIIELHCLRSFVIPELTLFYVVFILQRLGDPVVRPFLQVRCALFTLARNICIGLSTFLLLAQYFIFWSNLCFFLSLVSAGCSSILATSAVVVINHVDETSLYTSDISSGT